MLIVLLEFDLICVPLRADVILIRFILARIRYLILVAGCRLRVTDYGLRGGSHLKRGNSIQVDVALRFRTSI